MVRVRIAPSPTGFLHIGTARTALFNYLFAKRQKGVFVIRIEDTDLDRSDSQFEKDIFEGLRWLGIDSDEGPETGGPYAPYRQSERTVTYKKYIEKLLDEDRAFYCFHSEEELRTEKETLMREKKPPVHHCEYRTIARNDAAALRKEKPEHIIRFKTPTERAVPFHDLIRGDISFDSSLIGDFSIAKRPDVPLYNFAVVIDDYEMKISHVIRGEDHISNTPKQILLAEALGFPTPEFAHLPLILGPDRSKLSKRHAATSVNEYRAQGYLPEALFNFMALLGWNPGDNREILGKKDIIREFTLEKAQKAGAIFDIAKLDWMNGEYIRRKSSAELTELCEPFLKDFLQVPISNFQFPNGHIEKIIALEQPRLKKLSEIGEKIEYFFREPEYDKELLRWKGMTDEEIISSLEFSEKIISDFRFPISKKDIEVIFLETIGSGNKGKILWPLRVALSGKKASPGPFEIIEILGLNKAKIRLSAAKEKMKSLPHKNRDGLGNTSTA